MNDSFQRSSLIAIGEKMMHSDTPAHPIHILDASGTTTSTVGVNDNNANVDVDIEPDVKSNHVSLHLCACSLIFNCFTRETSSKTD